MPFGPTKEHPAYGVIVLTKSIGGNKKLFGSSLARHGSTICLTVHRAEIEHDLGKDWIYSKGHALIELEMSHTQFSELITTPGVMPGIPCTLTRVEGTRQAAIPEEETTEAENIQQAFMDDISDLLNSLSDTKARVEAIIQKKGAISKADREEIRSIHFEMTRVIEDYAPFAVKSFAKAAEKVASTAKAEIDAHVMSLAQQTGLQELRKLSLGGGFTAGELKQIESPQEDE